MLGGKIILNTGKNILYDLNEYEKVIDAIYPFVTPETRANIREYFKYNSTIIYSMMKKKPKKKSNNEDQYSLF